MTCLEELMNKGINKKEIFRDKRDLSVINKIKWKCLSDRVRYTFITSLDESEF